MSALTRRCPPAKRGTTIFCLIILLCSLLLARCQTVPATGETRLSLISTGEEIRIGREADSQIRTTMGIYDHEALQDYLGALAGIGLQLLFLKFSREDELEADELGVRYLIRIGENPRRLIEVMEMLERVSHAHGGGDIPQWLSTHPSPGDRRVNLAAIIEPLDESSFNPEDREGYLRRLDGLMYGKNPREGYAEGDLFAHPDLRFQVRFPSGWGIGNQKTAVFGTSPDGKAAMRVNQAETDDLEKAVRGFFAALTDPKALSVQPLRLEILSLRRSASLREYYEQRGSPIGLEELALLNRIDPNREIGQGQLIKWVEAGQQ